MDQRVAFSLVFVLLIGAGGAVGVGALKIPGLSTVGTAVDFSCLSQATALNLIETYPPGAMSPDPSGCGYDGYYTTGTAITNYCGSSCISSPSTTTISGTVTATSVATPSSTTTTASEQTSYCGSVAYNPATQTCVTNTSTSSQSTSTAISASSSTSQLSNATTVTETITLTNSTTSTGISTPHYAVLAGSAMAVAGVIGLVAVNRRSDETSD